jgi:hypothetical protein
MSLDASIQVYIWHGSSSKTFGMSSFLPSFGHVALETHLGGDSRYISFWPGCNKDFCSEKDPHYHTKDKDRICEGRPEDIPPISLMSLNVKKINDWFDANKHHFTWVFKGSTILKDSDEFNCAGLSYRLLEEGGILELVPYYKMSRIKKKVIAIVASISIFTPICLWSHYVIQPLIQMPQVFCDFAIGLLNLRKTVVKIFYNLESMHASLLSAESALLKVYQEELREYPQLKASVMQSIEFIKNRPKLTLFDDLPSNDASEYQFDAKALLLKNSLIEGFKKYAPFSTLGGVAALSAVVFGVSLAFFSHKIVADSITPADVEDLVSQAITVEKKRSAIRASSFLSIHIGWMACAIGVASIGCYFFRDALFGKRIA